MVGVVWKVLRVTKEFVWVVGQIMIRPILPRKVLVLQNVLFARMGSVRVVQQLLRLRALSVFLCADVILPRGFLVWREAVHVRGM